MWSPRGILTCYRVVQRSHSVRVTQPSCRHCPPLPWTLLRSFASDDSSISNDDEYSNPGSIYHPPTTYEIPASPIVLDSIRSALVGADDRTKDTGMSVMFLGTSAGLPSKARSPTSTLVRLGGDSILIDAGEGTQRQLMFTSAKLTKISRIFITHLHGDHIFGLPGLLLGLQHAYQLQHQGKESDREDPPTSSSNAAPPSPPHRMVKLYGPPGLYNYIASNIIFSCTLFHSVHIDVTELVGGRVRRAHGSRDIKNPFEVNYPEFNFGKITRRFLPCGPDGIWTIEDLPPHLTREDILSSSSSSPHKKVSRGTITGEKGKCRIQAAEVDHLSGVVTFGYSIEEEEPPRNLDVAKAKALGVSPVGRKYSLLKAGFSVLTDDGSRHVQPSQVVTETRKRVRRKVTVVGDNRAWTAAMKAVARNSDVLVHEATLMEKDPDWRKRGHSTAKMAGRMSGEVNAKLLVLNHISPKADYVGQDGPLSLIQDAQKGSNGVSEVLVAHDFMEIVVPWLGFGSTAVCDADAADNGVSPSPPTSITARIEEQQSNDKPLDTREVLQKWFGEKK